ncbi:MAG: hypothetical protein ACKO0V_22420 [bacterium]
MLNRLPDTHSSRLRQITQVLSCSNDASNYAGSVGGSYQYLEEVGARRPIWFRRSNPAESSIPIFSAILQAIFDQ